MYVFISTSHLQINADNLFSNLDTPSVTLTLFLGNPATACTLKNVFETCPGT